ncbi:MAG TPA: lipoprotein insertase outer membrane protein LolB [Noviherbaspirillum sp.]|nr:lipoprotein insertase outer membrane protein LolB [Noviherbaspirillum sp.]
MIFFAVLRWAAASTLPLLVAACASVSLPSAPGSEATSPSPITGARIFHDTIDFGGRLSVRYQNDQKEEGLHGSFIWTQTPVQTQITLLSPLGQTLAVINVTPLGATLMQAGQPIRSATDVDALTAETLGWPLPVAGLRSWLQGFATDRTGRRFVATPHTTDVTTGDGWQIRYANWADDVAPPSQNRPKRIDLARYTEQAGNVSIRIVLDTWQAH